MFPRFVRESKYTEWEKWFAWYPVKTEQGTWVFLRHTYRRINYPPIWFVPPAPVQHYEYSDTQKNQWEDMEDNGVFG